MVALTTMAGPVCQSKWNELKMPSPENAGQRTIVSNI
jgi:hypothetical protein